MCSFNLMTRNVEVLSSHLFLHLKRVSFMQCHFSASVHVFGVSSERLFVLVLKLWDLGFGGYFLLTVVLTPLHPY